MQIHKLQNPEFFCLKKWSEPTREILRRMDPLHSYKTNSGWLA
jgi:hypothetical protein